MQSRDVRFWLLFESGPRDGERVPLSGEACTLGRSESNAIVLAHASVSGTHAEVEVRGDIVILRDAGSRNGTRVDGRRIEEQELGHGDLVQFGTVRARFQDGEVAGVDAQPAGNALGAAPSALGSLGASGAALGTVSVDVLARSKSRSKGWLLLVIVAFAGLGFIGWRTFVPSEAREKRERVVPSVAGNLLANPSFEEDGAPAWVAAEAASQAFFVDSGFARRGGLGLGVVLTGEEWALSRSEPLRVSERKIVELSASLRAEGSAQARVGLELSSQEEAGPRILAWAVATGAGSPDSPGAFQTASLTFTVPAGYSRARVLVAARIRSVDATGGAEESEVAIDDVSVLSGSGSGADPGPNTVSFEEYELTVLGAGGSTAILSRSGRVLFTGISLSHWDTSGLAGWAGGGWKVRATANGFLLDVIGDPPAAARCEFIAYRTRPLAAGSSGSYWLATLGSSGYRSHALTFERKEATDLLLGGGVNMLRLRARAGDSEDSTVPTTMRGLSRGEDAAFAVSMGSATTLEIQLSFDEERVAAERLALEARSAATAGESGAALSAWGELLDHWAFDATLIAEGETVRAALLRAGHTRLGELELAVDRADFFRLRDAYLRCGDGVRELAAEFTGTELEAKAAELEARIAYALTTLESDHAGDDVHRLRGVLSALEGSEDSSLFGHVRAMLAAHESRAGDHGEGDPGE